MSRQSRLFLVLTFALTWICCWCLALLSGRGISETGDLLYWVLLIARGSSPTMFAYVAVALCNEESLSALNQRVFNFTIALPYYIFAIFVPVAIAFSGQLFLLLQKGDWALNMPANWLLLALPLFISSVLMGGHRRSWLAGVVATGFGSSLATAAA